MYVVCRVVPTVQTVNRLDNRPSTATVVRVVCRDCRPLTESNRVDSSMYVVCRVDRVRRPNRVDRPYIQSRSNRRKRRFKCTKVTKSRKRPFRPTVKTTKNRRKRKKPRCRKRIKTTELRRRLDRNRKDFVMSTCTSVEKCKITPSVRSNEQTTDRTDNRVASTNRV